MFNFYPQLYTAHFSVEAQAVRLIRAHQQCSLQRLCRLGANACALVCEDEVMVASLSTTDSKELVVKQLRT